MRANSSKKRSSFGIKTWNQRSMTSPDFNERPEWIEPDHPPLGRETHQKHPCGNIGP